MKYYNNDNIQYVLTALDGSPNLENVEKITIDKDIAIITNLNENSILIKQLNKNKIKYYNLNNIDKITENYSLLVFNKDAVIVNNLDNIFINKFLDFNKDYIFCGMIIDYPFIDSPIYKNNLLPTFNRYINSSLCFAYTDIIKKIVVELQYSNKYDNTVFEQNNHLIYANHNDNFNFKNNIDIENKLFTSIYDKTNNLFLVDNNGFIGKELNFNASCIVINGGNIENEEI